MRRRALAAVLAAAALARPRAQGIAAPVSDGSAVARKLIVAMAANDAQRIRAVFAADASQAYADGAPKRGKAFFDWLESDIIALHGRVDDPVFKADGKEVVVTGQYRNRRGYRAAANFLFVVEGQRIVSWRMRY
jgi:hypothetical protein